MNLGFIMRWPKGSLSSRRGNVIGDELLGESLAAAIRNQPGECHAELYAPNSLPADRLDVLVYLNDMPLLEKYARRHVIYFQNGGFDRDARTVLRDLHERGFDDYVFFSRLLLDLHLAAGGKGLFLPFGVDLDTFYPRPVSAAFSHEIAYVGNDIKGADATMKYLYPAIDHDFGLYGNWRRTRASRLNPFNREPPYKRQFDRLSRGKIRQEDIPVLYSSARINLNCTLEDCIEWDVITLRTLEVLACRGFLISDTVASAAELMAECMVFTSGGDDLREKIGYYLANAAERERIAGNGYEYVRQHGSVGARARDLLNYLS